MSLLQNDHIIKKYRFHGFRPRYISVPMYREIVHLVAVHHYTLHSAWVEAWAQSAVESPSGGSKRCARSMQQSCGSNGSNGNPAVGDISVPMYREIVHLVAVHHYTLHSAWIEANTNLFLRSEDHEYCKD